MYIGSWHTRVQVPKAAAFTCPSLSTVVISTRHELGAKILSHHSGRISILWGMLDINCTSVVTTHDSSRRHSGAPQGGEPGIHTHGGRLWIPGFLAALGPRNDGKKREAVH